MLRAGQLYIQERYGIGFSAEAITTGFLANKKPHSCWLLLILWVSSIAYSYVVNVRNEGDKQFVTLTKTMQILTALNIKLLKTVTANVLESRQLGKIFYEIAKVLKDSGEGQHFLLQAGARKQLKMLSWSHWQARWVWRLFYINDIIASLQKPKKQYKSFVMNYNTQLCNTAWGKKLLARVTQCTCFCSKNRDRNFFRSVGKGVATEI